MQCRVVIGLCAFAMPGLAGLLSADETRPDAAARLHTHDVGLVRVVGDIRTRDDGEFRIVVGKLSCGLQLAPDDLKHRAFAERFVGKRAAWHRQHGCECKHLHEARVREALQEPTLRATLFPHVESPQPRKPRF